MSALSQLGTKGKIGRRKQMADGALDILFTWILESGGVITGEHGVGLAKKRWIKDALGKEGFEAHSKVKRVFDRKGTLNLGKLLDD